jgi:myo-inositol-1(or 4)-monophosphatase
VTAAAVYLPILDLMFAATHDGPATMNGYPIQPSDAQDVIGATVLAHMRNYDADNWIGPVPAFDRQFRSSLAYRLCLVAKGEFDAMLTLRGTWEWDVAAGDLIATRAGATVTDKYQKRPVYNRPHPRLRGMVAAGPRLHSEITQRLLLSPLSTV